MQHFLVFCVWLLGLMTSSPVHVVTDERRASSFLWRDGFHWIDKEDSVHWIDMEDSVQWIDMEDRAYERHGDEVEYHIQGAA